MRFTVPAVLAIALATSPSLALAQEFSRDVVAPTYADNMKSVQAGQVAIYQGPGSAAAGLPPSFVLPDDFAQNLAIKATSPDHPPYAPPVLHKMNPPASN